VIDTTALPLYAGAHAAAEAGTRTGGDARNREYVAGRLAGTVSPALDALVHDPQTSGGLLAAVEPAAVTRLVDAGFTVIGSVQAGEPGVDLI
jgi:selenide,water dikinase